MSAVILAVFLSRSRGPVADPRAALPAPPPVAPARPANAPPGTIAPLLSAPKPTVAPAVAKYVPPTGPIRADKLDAQTLLKRFAGWADAYAAAPLEQRGAMLREGGALAEARRDVMREMIQKNPAEAIRQAVPYAVRKQLPAAILALLEQPVSGHGDFNVYGATPMPGQRKSLKSSVSLIMPLRRLSENPSWNFIAGSSGVTARWLPAFSAVPCSTFAT